MKQFSFSAIFNMKNAKKTDLSQTKTVKVSQVSTDKEEKDFAFPPFFGNSELKIIIPRRVLLHSL